MINAREAKKYLVFKMKIEKHQSYTFYRLISKLGYTKAVILVRSENFVAKYPYVTNLKILAQFDLNL